MKRQTRFTLEELIHMIETGQYSSCPGNGKGGYPLGVLLNDVGIIFKETGDSTAEDLLVNMLVKDDPGAKFISYCFLAMKLEKLSDEARLLFRGFEEIPQNAGLIKKAKVHLRKL